ncbi:hypothetical protein JHK87_041645 [Glycine soja]|nr:hypothetical protein JHK87_041645 [Glycine soja]
MEPTSSRRVNLSGLDVLLDLLVPLKIVGLEYVLNRFYTYIIIYPQTLSTRGSF